MTLKPTSAPGSGEGLPHPGGPLTPPPSPPSCPSRGLSAWTRGPYLQPLDAIAHTGLECQGEQQRLADLRSCPHRRAAGAPGGRTLEEPRRSASALRATVARPRAGLLQPERAEAAG